MESWCSVVEDEVVDAAILNRLLHRYHVVNICGRSCRMWETKATYGRAEDPTENADATVKAPFVMLRVRSLGHEVDNSATFELDIDKPPRDLSSGPKIGSRMEGSRNLRISTPHLVV